MPAVDHPLQGDAHTGEVEGGEAALACPGRCTCRWFWRELLTCYRGALVVRQDPGERSASVPPRGERADRLRGGLDPEAIVRHADPLVYHWLRPDIFPLCPHSQRQSLAFMLGVERSTDPGLLGSTSFRGGWLCDEGEPRRRSSSEPRHGAARSPNANVRVQSRVLQSAWEKRLSSARWYSPIKRRRRRQRSPIGRR
jgi:hypothetical protein